MRTEAEWQARERELLAANNRYLQEARDARAEVARLQAGDKRWGALHQRVIDERASLLKEVEALQTQRFDLVGHLSRLRDFSATTFGPGARTKGVVDHIRKELAEIEADPADLSEWIDVIILACDGALRAGHTPEAIIAAWIAKQARNENRKWPDWRDADPDEAIEHVKDPVDG